MFAVFPTVVSPPWIFAASSDSSESLTWFCGEPNANAKVEKETMSCPLHLSYRPGSNSSHRLWNATSDSTRAMVTRIRVETQNLMKVFATIMHWTPKYWEKKLANFTINLRFGPLAFWRKNHPHCKVCLATWTHALSFLWLEPGTTCWCKKNSFMCWVHCHWCSVCVLDTFMSDAQRPCLAHIHSILLYLHQQECLSHLVGSWTSSLVVWPRRCKPRA